MSSIASVNPTASQPSQSAPAAQAASTDSAVAALGLPPANLAQAASVNTVNAALVSSQFGVDPALVAGVYGGSAQNGSALFSSAELLPALANLTKANAEQSLSLLGIQTPKVGGSSTSSQAGGSSSPNAPIPPSATLGAAVVDPLWGKMA
jgi:hypothetical protein